jgi:hypothetical protein
MGYPEQEGVGRDEPSHGGPLQFQFLLHGAYEDSLFCVHADCLWFRFEDLPGIADNVEFFTKSPPSDLPSAHRLA